RGCAVSGIDQGGTRSQAIRPRGGRASRGGLPLAAGVLSQARPQRGTAGGGEAVLGVSSVRVAVWETEVASSDRHHLRVDVAVEAAFWVAYDSGHVLTAAAGSARFGRSTALRVRAPRIRGLR